MKKRVALYIRVSSEEQAREGYSLDAQKNQLIEYAKNNDYEIVDLYVDEGVSARKKYTKRKGLMRLLEDIKKDKIDLILFIKIDRWFRSVSDYYKIQEILEEHKVDWMTTMEEYDTTTASGRLYINIRLSIAQDEADRTGERIKFVFKSKVQKNEYIAKNVPLGYKLKEKKLVIDEKTEHIAKFMFNTFVKTKSMRKTMLKIREDYYYDISYNAVRNFLKNKIYVGEYRGNNEFCKRMISQKKFEDVQTIIRENASKLNKKKRNYIFTSLIECPFCGRKMCGTLGDRYICSRYRHDMRCGFGSSLKEKFLEDYIKKFLKIDTQKYESLSAVEKNDYLKSIIERIIPFQNLKNFKIVLKK